MFFVLVSHFASAFLRLPEQQSLQEVLYLTGMVATPSFVILSGVLLGVLFHRSGDGFCRIQAKLIDRGLFLLVVGHAVICAALFASEHTWTWLLSTDAIGVAMVVGAIVIRFLSRRLRLAISTVAYGISWIVVYAAFPHDSHAQAAKELLFGTLTPTVFTGGFPIVPWTAVYLASTVLGERLAVLLSRNAPARAAVELASTGASGIATVILVKLSMLWFSGAPLRHASAVILRVGHKHPPAPLYLLFYGGMALVFLAGWLFADTYKLCERTIPTVAACGQSSLFIFMSHFYVYGLVSRYLAPGSLFEGLIYFVASTCLIFVFARSWQRHGCNSFLTVGYEAFWRAQPFRRPAFIG